jgi:micrococcal nuclease
LAYVERAEDGLFVNLDLVAGGWADDYPFPPNVAHQRDFALAVADARAEGRGLWGACGDADTVADGRP